jgi:capsid protein
MPGDSYTIDCLQGLPLPSIDAAPSGSRNALASVSSDQSFAQSNATDASALRLAEKDLFHFDTYNSPDSAYNSRAHFESAETDRLNEAHWLTANEIPVNDVLHMRLPVMRARSSHEALNNPTIEGLMLSHTLAVVGEDGPLIDLWSEDDAGDAWCEEAEKIWEEWAECPDAAGQLSLGSMLKNWNTTCWRAGEFIEQLVNEDERYAKPGVPTLRMHGIEPQRLVSPFTSMADPDVILGVRRNKYRRPIEYYISEMFNYLQSYGKGEWIQARNIVHGYDLVQAERGQARGIPWAQSGLPISADLRDYDTQVLDAARSAADMAIIAFTRHPDADFAANVPKSIEFRRRRINHVAPGWEVTGLPSTQPTAQYKEHRTERMGDLGKGKSVPSMITRLDARDHNYSSARFDYQLLGESAKHVRATLYNPVLRRLAMLVISEAILSGRLRPSPRRFYMEFIWPALPEIDEMKSAEAEEKYLKIGTVSYTDACARRHGQRARDIIRRRQRDARILSAAGLPSVQEATGRGAQPQGVSPGS